LAIAVISPGLNVEWADNYIHPRCIITYIYIFRNEGEKHNAKEGDEEEDNGGMMKMTMTMMAEVMKMLTTNRLMTKRKRTMQRA
jgi:hypothetical protein